MATDIGFYKIAVEDIRFAGDPFDADVPALRQNKTLPIIVIERNDRYYLLDGWNRVSGLRNAGIEWCYAILVSEEDLSSRAGGDDEEWIEEMWDKYTPWLIYRRGH